MGLGRVPIGALFVVLLLGIVGTTVAQDGSQEYPFVNATTLPMDIAEVRMVIPAGAVPAATNLVLTGITSLCYECLKLPLLSVSEFEATGNTSTEYLWLDTTFPFDFVLTDLTTNESLSFSYHFKQQGSYSLIVGMTANGSLTQMTSVDVEPTNAYVPLIVAAIILIVAAAAWVAYRVYRRRKQEVDQEMLERDGSVNSIVKPKPSRLSSLDAFRGMCIGVMIFVNYGGGGYWFFNHSTWNGLTFADLVFPWFIFIMGVAMPLSFRALEKRKTPKREILIKVARRSIILFALGLFISNGSSLPYYRVPGVLQRFGVTYFVNSLIIMYIPKLTVYEATDSDRQTLLGNSDGKPKKPKHWAKDFIPYSFQWHSVLALLALYLCLTFFLHVPGCPTGYLGPGGLADNGMYPNCTGGAAGYIDKQIFGENHIYQWPTCKSVYETGPYDPEGTLGYLTSIFLCFIGVQAGRVMQYHKGVKHRVMRLVFWGLFWGVIGTILCKGGKNDGWIPINKNLWSPSFIFVMGGTGNLVLALCYLLVDVFSVWNGAPFIYVGMNPILIYCGHELLADHFPLAYQTTSSYASHGQNLAGNLIGVGCWMMVAYALYLNKIFVAL